MQESLWNAIPRHGQSHIEPSMPRCSRESSPLGPQDGQWRSWGAPQAFEAWVLAYQAEVFSFVCGLIDNPNEADGVAAGAFAQVHALAHRGQIKDTPVAELYRIATRESARRLSRRLRTHPDDRRQLAWRILMRLDENERLLLLLREAAGYSVPQIAVCLSTSEEQVRSRLLEARQSFLAACKRLEGGSGDNGPDVRWSPFTPLLTLLWAPVLVQAAWRSPEFVHVVVYIAVRHSTNHQPSSVWSSACTEPD